MAYRASGWRGSAARACSTERSPGSGRPELRVGLDVARVELQRAQVRHRGFLEPPGVQVALGEAEVGGDVAWVLTYAPLQALERRRARTSRGGVSGRRLSGDHLAGATVADRAVQQRRRPDHHDHADQRGHRPAWPAPAWQPPAGAAAGHA